MSDFRVIQGCPCNSLLAPYVALLVREAHATVNSIYRGEDAAAILHANGKSTQAEILQSQPEGTNPVGRSTHELRSDGHAYPGPPGRALEWWQQGIDVNDGDVSAMKRRAQAHGWELFQPYPSPSGKEFHHLNFRHRPQAGAAMRARLVLIRARLPKS